MPVTRGGREILLCVTPTLGLLNMRASQLFGLIAGLLAILTYAVYARQISRGASIPNPATCLIWVALGVINSCTYAIAVHFKWHEALIAIAVTCCIALISIYALLNGKFARLSRTDNYCLSGCVLILGLWSLTRSARLANLLTQLVYVISYLPIVSGLKHGVLRESPAAWVFAAVAYIFATFAVLADFHGDWLILIYPVVSGVACNAVIAWLAFHDRASRTVNVSSTNRPA